MDTDGGYGGGGSWDSFLNDIVQGAIGIIDAVQDGRGGGPYYPGAQAQQPAAAAGNDGLLLIALLVLAVYFISES